MRGGFTFCGTDITELGLEYAPDNADTYVYREADYKTDEESFEGHDGGFHYGETLNPKPFRLRCYYTNNNEQGCSGTYPADSHVNHGQMARIVSFFRRGKTGRLVFKERPWLYYIATITDTDVSQMYNANNGLVTIQMKAYYPFARTDLTVYDSAADDAELIKQNTALLPSGMNPSSEIISSGNEMTAETSFVLYNGGSERADVAIEIAGNVGEGVTIRNNTTGQECKFVALTKSITTGRYLVCDGINGKTVLTNNVNSEIAFLYHDHGFIQLAPAFPILEDISVSYTAGSASVTSSGKFTDDMLGKHIYIDGAWRKINVVSSSSGITVYPSPTHTGTATTNIVQMNEITVTPESTMALTRLNFRYKPTFE